jgi:DNA repair protein RadA/Sms
MSAKKAASFFRCSACGHEETKWLGRCPECGEWNTFRESLPETDASRGPRAAGASRQVRARPLASVRPQEGSRTDSGTEELNRVLGGGIVPGASILVGGEPGIGKSTLMLQVAASAQTSGAVLYVSGEESAEQLRMRADRLSIARAGLHVLCETQLEAIERVIESVQPALIVVDSIQTLHSPDAGAVPGTVNQIKFCCHELISWAKEHAVGLFLVAHVTKEGIIAGPKVIEHMVDTVLYFDRSESEIRVLRASKNRFGSVDEIGLFTMDEQGLRQVADPSSLFLVQRKGELPPGVVVAPVYEGSRVLMVELQALTVPAKGGVSRVFSDRIDSSRVSRVAAVLEKHVELRFSDQDVYVNVAGGMRIGEVAVELPLAMALYSARIGMAAPVGTAMCGELSLAGELRPVSHLRRRLRAASEMGFATLVGPPAVHDEPPGGDGYVEAASIRDAVATVFGNKRNSR